MKASLQCEVEQKKLSENDIGECRLLLEILLIKKS
jgi:hypothetical protein